MAQNDYSKLGFDDGGLSPIKRFAASRFVRKEVVLKQEIEAYFVSDVDNSAFLRMGKRAVTICQSLDLPDCVCEGLTYKQRLVQTELGDCLLLARWKPDRHMRRAAPDWSQRWFVEKQLYPPDQSRFFTRLEKRFQDLAAEAAAAPPPVAFSATELEDDLAPPDAPETPELVATEDEAEE